MMVLLLRQRRRAVMAARAPGTEPGPRSRQLRRMNFRPPRPLGGPLVVVVRVPTSWPRLMAAHGQRVEPVRYAPRVCRESAMRLDRVGRAAATVVVLFGAFGLAAP